MTVGAGNMEVAVNIGNVNVGTVIGVEVGGRAVEVNVGAIKVGAFVEVEVAGMEVAMKVGGSDVFVIDTAVVETGVVVNVGPAVAEINVGMALGVANTGASGHPMTLTGKLAGSPPGGRTYLATGKLRNDPKSAPAGTRPEETK